ncbi:hypothetical protein BC827DRAFT_490730 [Russula dissimulans]|nr:hypothetical protein BC827DRAFT_490730 [Russula dissimulans]
MPRDSSEKSKAPQSLKFQQSLIDVLGSAIEARVIQERDLEPDHFGWLLGPDPNSPRSVGISPAYSQSGGLPALACALDSRVLIINFLSSTAYADGNVNGGGTRPRNTKRREMLEEKLLCHPLVTLYAFDLVQLALCLHLHTHLRLTEAIDIQSALHIPDRSIVDSVKVVLSDTIPIFSDNIHNTFENMLYKSNKDIELMGLVQRAWLCGWIGQYDYEGIRDMFYKSPKVDMTKFSAGVRNLLFIRSGLVPR